MDIPGLLQSLLGSSKYITCITSTIETSVCESLFSSAMLVLTTMFINVSNNLPKTSYVKMIDIWLIFNLLLPFIEVLVHTFMDTLR